MFAVLVACLRDPRPLDIRSDSEWVCNVFASWHVWAETGWSGDHADLWNMLANEVAGRTSAVTVTWVKGHAKEIDVMRGRTTREDKIGNDGADELARDGADMHRVPSEVVEEANRRRTHAIHTHKMMLAILIERLNQETSLTAEADRGSEMGEDLFVDVDFDNEPSDNEHCMELLNDAIDSGSVTLSSEH